MNQPRKKLILRKETVRNLKQQGALRPLKTPGMNQVEGGGTPLWFVIATEVFCPLSKFFNDSASFPPNSNNTVCLCPPEESDFCPPKSQSCPTEPIPIPDMRFHM